MNKELAYLNLCTECKKYFWGYKNQYVCTQCENILGEKKDGKEKS